MHRTLIVSGFCLLSSACTWVSLNEGADAVLVLPAERLAPACASLGKVKVSVLENVGVLERHEDEVIEDLDALARNHAAKTGGDTVVARGPVSDGVREYEVFRCVKDGARSENSDDGEAETLPYRER